jgi:hypothetical protein
MFPFSFKKYEPENDSSTDGSKKASPVISHSKINTSYLNNKKLNKSKY